MLVKSFPTPWLKSNMYLLIEKRRGILVDAYASQAYFDQFEKWVDSIDYIILTHEHYDHISGTNAIRQRYRCPVLCGEACSQRIQNPTQNFSRYFNAYVSLQTGEHVPDELLPVEEYSTHADISFQREHHLSWQGHGLVLSETPGHSPGSICILVDQKYLFSGDTLLPEKSPMTRFPDGNRHSYEQVALPYLQSLPGDVTVYPGHYHSFPLRQHPVLH